MANPEARPGAGRQLVFGVFSIVAVVICFVLGFSHYLDYGLDRQGWHYLVGLVMAFCSAYNCLRTPNRSPGPQNESAPVSVPPPPFAATAILVGIGSMFFSMALLGLIMGGSFPRLFLIVLSVSGLCIVLLVRNYLKLSKEYLNWRKNAL